MSARQPQSYNVKFPRGDHAARLGPGQELRLHLYAPEECGFPSGCDWVVKTNSHFLELQETETVERKDGPITVFTFSQKDVPRRWQALSHVFLGNIHILMKQSTVGRTDDVAPCVDYYATVQVFFDCVKDHKKDIVTVIAPTEHEDFRQSIRLEPRQTLEVVVADLPHQSPMEWRAYVMPDEQSAQLMLSQSHVEFLPKGEGVGTHKSDSLYYIERRILPHGDGCSPCFGEQHFFFQFEDLASDYVEQLENGIHPACRVIILGKGEDGYCVDRRLNVKLALRGCVRRREAQYAASSHGKVETVPDPLERIMDVDRRILVNPGKTEQVSIFGSGDTFSIDIIQPSQYFLMGDLFDSASWRAVVKPATRCDRRSHLVKVAQTGAARWIGGKRFQRFQIRLDEPSEAYKELMMGKLILSCPELESHVPSTELTIHILLCKDAKQRPVYDRQYQVDGENYTVKSWNDGNGASAWKGSENSGVNNIYNRSNSHQHHNGSSKNSRKKSRRKYWKNNPHNLEYYEVSIDDVSIDNDLATGEVVELMSGQKLSSPSSSLPSLPLSPMIGPRYYDPDAYLDKHEGPLSNMIDTATTKKKRIGNKGGVSGSSNSGLSESAQSLLPSVRNGTESTNLRNEAAAVLAEARERNKNMLTPDAEGACRLSHPQHRQTVRLRRGQSLIIKVMLPKGEFRNGQLRQQWTVNTIDMMADEKYKVWINSSRLVETQEETHLAYQKIEVFPLTPRDAEEGVHRIGAIRLQCGPVTKMINIDLEITPGDRRESLRNWLDYWRSLKNAKNINVGSPFEVSTSKVGNRTTLIDPVGETIDIPVRQSHEIEIILTDFSRGEWDIQPRLIGGGKWETLDYSVYRLWSGERVCRGLFRVTRHIADDPLFGEIKIFLNGEDTNTRIRPHSTRGRQKNPLLEHPEQRDMVRVSGDPDKPQKIHVSNWRNRQHVVVFPTDYLHVEVPHLRDVLDDRYGSEELMGQWKVDICETSLTSDVWGSLPPDIQGDVDKIAPYYAHHGILHPGPAPWEYNEFVLPPLDMSQPLIDEILKALRKERGVRVSYPIAELRFSREIAERFTMEQTLYINLGDPLFAQNGNGTNCICLDDPPDHSKVSLHNERLLTVRLPIKSEPSSRDDQGEPLLWSLEELPTWLVRLDYALEAGYEIFNFFTELTPVELEAREKVTGILRFVCGDNYLEKKITLIAESD